jgi:hypothetical protein
MSEELTNHHEMQRGGPVVVRHGHSDPRGLTYWIVVVSTIAIMFAGIVLLAMRDQPGGDAARPGDNAANQTTKSPDRLRE